MATEFVDIKSLVRQLKPLLISIRVQAQTQFNNLLSSCENNLYSKQAVEAYNAWQAFTNGIYTRPQEEFCLQTAYLQFVRIFFVRACEDHGLIPYLIVDDNLVSTIKDAYRALLTTLYLPVCLDNHFGNQDFFDWFTPDPQSIMSLFHLLRCYNFKDVRMDVLGRIYDEGFIENKGRSEKGQFYTPSHIVEYMLDTLGMPGCGERENPVCAEAHTFLEKTVGDISCGSGSFLVAVAARKRAILQHLVASLEVNSEYALQIMRNTLLGFDLNPFACYLSEINLLMQCLPFITDEQGQICRSVERLHIYCLDALNPTSTKQIELVTGYHGLDYLVGNPPYVSADESSEHLRYREKVSGYGIYQLLYQRWDLFVPFFERNLQFLRPGTGRLGLIVSNGIETEGYAERLRQALCSRYCLLQIDFFPRLRLFQDAAVESTMVFLENVVPVEGHQVKRRRHFCSDCKQFETLMPVLQPTQVFRWRFDALLDRRIAEGSISLCAIAYIGTGIEAQSDEHFDPLIDGKRQKRFTLDDVFLPTSMGEVRSSEYTDDGVVGDDVDRYYLRRKRYVAYEKFGPLMRGPRHIALFRTPEKLLLGETSGGYYDRDGLFANHSVQVVVSWKALEMAGALEERGIRRVLRKSQQIAGVNNDLPTLSEQFDLRYILGIINSRFMRAYLISNMHEGTRKNRIYPDVWKHLPIKIATPERQKEIATLVDAAQEGYRQLDIMNEDERVEIMVMINSHLVEIERLVEALYSVPADSVIL